LLVGAGGKEAPKDQFTPAALVFVAFLGAPVSSLFTEMSNSTSVFNSVLDDYYFIMFSPVFFCTMAYGVLYLLAGTVAAFAMTNDKPLVKVVVILASTIWGMFSGFIASVVVFSLLAGIYVSLPAPMLEWQAIAWGVGLCILMQLIAVVRRLYVYV
jgi:hypothetical protein